MKVLLIFDLCSPCFADKTQTMNGKTLGTTRYRAPFGGNYFEDDMYSFGMTLWELFAEEKPFHVELSKSNPMYTNLDISSFVASSELHRPNIEKCGYDCPQDLKDLIESCWKLNPTQRPNIAKAYQVVKSAFNKWHTKKRPRLEE